MNTHLPTDTGLLDPRLATRVALEHFGLRARAEALPAEVPGTFTLEVPGGRRVLKIRPPAERPLLALQAAMLDHLSRQEAGLPVPRVVPTRTGEPFADVEVGGGIRPAQLLTWLPGRPLAGVRPVLPELLEAVGRLLGRTDAALLDFRHAAAERPGFAWHPERTSRTVAAGLAALGDPERRALVERTMDVCRPALERLSTLRRSVIHGDANDHNLLVGPPGRNPDVVGLIDFGDALEAPAVAEPAVAVAYLMLGRSDPLAAAAPVVRGYHEVLPLTEEELAVVVPLARSRLCVSVVLSAARSEAARDNPYLRVSEDAAWQALAILDRVHPRFAEAGLRRACGLPASPSTPHVVRWLGSRVDGLGPVLDASLEGAPVLDLGVGAEDGAPLERPEDASALARRIAARLEAAGARVAIGRYDEPRLLYAGPAFEAGGDEQPERRTVHLGLDLFADPGTPVRAPLDAVIRGVADHPGRLDYGPTVVLEHTPAGGPTFWSLYGHLARASLEGRAPGDHLRRGDVLGRVGGMDENGGWPPHLHLQLIVDLLGREDDFPGVSSPSERDVWTDLSPDPAALVPLAGRAHRAPRSDPEALVRERRRILGPSLSLSYARPLHIVRGRGVHLYDASGRAWLDGVNNVCHVGHAHPAVVEAAARQMSVLNTNTRYLHEHLLEYARRLAALLPDRLEVCWFVCSGSEANELALRMARTATGRRDVVVLEGAYHGNTGGLVDVSPYKFDGPGGGGRPEHVQVAPMPDDFRGAHRREDPDRGLHYAAGVEEALGRAARRPGGSGGAAALLVESLLSCGGQIEPPPGFLQAAFHHARRAGAVCIADEVQVGFGRVGSHFWGFETQGVVPDIVTMGKPMGNGHPVAAVVTTREIARAFDTGMEYFSSFGGNPVSCAVGLAVLDVIRDEGLQERALRVGARLEAGLRELKDRHPVVGDVRGRGLFLGVELVRDPDILEAAADEAAWVVERARDHGVLLSTDGPLHNVVKIKPPLVFSEEDASRTVEVLDRVLREDPVRG